MTFSKRYYAKPADVLSVRLSCTKCKASISLPVEERAHGLEYCPHCRCDWFPDGSIDLQVLVALIRALASLRNRKAEAPCSVEMEFEQPPA